MHTNFVSEQRYFNSHLDDPRQIDNPHRIGKMHLIQQDVFAKPKFWGDYQYSKRNYSVCMLVVDAGNINPKEVHEMIYTLKIHFECFAEMVGNYSL